MSTSQITLAHFDAETFDSILSIPQSRGVNETERPFATIDHCLKCSARRPGNFRYNRPGPTQKRIEQRRFSDVRRTRDNDDCTIANDLAGWSSREKGIERARNCFHSLINSHSRNGSIVFLGKIDIVRDQRLEADEIIPQAQQATRQPSVQLAESRPLHSMGARIYQ